MNHPHALVRFALAAGFVALISSCASPSAPLKEQMSIPTASGQQALSTPTATPATAAQVAQKAASAAKPDATALEEAAHSALLTALPTPDATAQEEAVVIGGPAAPPPAVPASLQDEIFLAGAPLFAIMFFCEQLAPDTDLPAVTWQQAEGIGQLCLYGFAEGEEVRYEIRDSEGVEVEAGITESSTLDSPQPAAAVVLTVESYAPGQWVVTASSTSVNMQDTFEVAAREGPPLIAMRLSTGEEAIKGSRGLTGLQGGDEVLVYAVHLPPDTEIPVGVYYAAEEDYAGSTLSLHEQATMSSDEAGALSIRLLLDPSYRPGFYCVVIAAAESYVPERGPGEGGATECFAVSAEVATLRPLRPNSRGP